MIDRTAKTGRWTLVPFALVALTVAPLPAEGQGPSSVEIQQQTRTKEITHSVEVGDRRVALSGSGMRVNVVAGESDMANLDATVEYWSEDEGWMDLVADGFGVQLRETGSRIDLVFDRMPNPEGRGLLGRLRRLLNSDERYWALDVILTVPVGTDVELVNSYGPVDVTGVGGPLTVENSSGAVRVADAGAVTIRNSYAEVFVEHATGPVDVESSSAEVRVVGVAAGVDVVTSYAAALIEDVGGDVAAEVGSGGLTVRDVRGSVRTRNTYATATIEDVSGRLDHESASGDVRIRRIGGAVRAVGSYGEMSVTEAGSVDVRNGSGAVSVLDIRGDARISNSYAMVEARSIEGSLTVESASAGVAVENVGGDLTVTTSYDGVRVEGVGGAVTIRNSSGRATVSGFRGAALRARHTIETSYGGIEVDWPGGADLAIDAESSYGTIDSELDGRITGAESSSLQRLVRESETGARLRLVATSGSIRIRER